MTSHEGTPALERAPSIIRTGATAAWAVLMVATLISWWLGGGHGAEAVAAVGVLGVAFLKVGLVGHYFMELRYAPLSLRLVFTGWAVVVCSALIVMYVTT
jgi:hypothetical protein